jgi:hypothetical protein
MKRIFVAVIFFTVCITVFAQQANRISNRPTPDQTRENMKQYLEQGKLKASNFESIQAELNARNMGNDDERRFNQLKTETERLGASIKAEQYKISLILEKGSRVSNETLDNVQRMIDKHREKLAELETFTSGSSSAK